MSLFDRLFSRLGYTSPDRLAVIVESATKAALAEHVPDFFRVDAELSRWSLPDGSLAHNQADLYRVLSWVQAAVLSVAQTAATTAFSVKRRTGEKQRDIVNHPFEVLLQRPNPLDSRFELLETTFAYRKLCGNAYWWLNRASPDEMPTEIWPIPPYKILPIPDGKSYLSGYAFYPEGMFGSTMLSEPLYPLETWEVVHFKSFHPLSRFVGLSPIEALSTIAVGDLAAQKYNTRFFDDENAKVPGALAFADNIPKPDWDDLKLQMKEQHGGTKRQMMMLRNVGKGGVEWVKMGLSQGEMEFLRGRQFTKEEIFSVFAPGLASVLDVNATEANAKSGKASFVEFSIWPLLVSVAEKITNDILPIYDRRSPDSLIGTFDDIRPVDRELALHEQAEAGKWLTRDEMRDEYYSRGKLPDGHGRLPLGDTAPVGGDQLATMPNLLPTKAALLRVDEQSLLDRLRDPMLLAGASPASTVRASLLPVVSAAMGTVAASYGAHAPIAEWAASWVDAVVPTLLDAIQGGPGPGDDWSWLARMIVGLLTRARAWVVVQLQSWLQERGDGRDLVWSTMGDSQVCQRCYDLEGRHQSSLPSEVAPPLHDYCRCGWSLVAAPYAQGALL